MVKQKNLEKKIKMAEGKTLRYSTPPILKKSKLKKKEITPMKINQHL